MTETPALKPCPVELRECPFCGGEGGLRDYSGLAFVAKCVTPYCGTGPIERCAPDAIAAWNKRSVGPSAPLSAGSISQHWSDCALHNEPAEPNDICSCGADPVPSLIRALASAVDYMKDAGAFMDDHPSINHGLLTAKAIKERSIGSQASDNPPASMPPSPPPVSEEGKAFPPYSMVELSAVRDELHTLSLESLSHSNRTRYSRIGSVVGMALVEIAYLREELDRHKALKGGGRDGVIEEAVQKASWAIHDAAIPGDDKPGRNLERRQIIAVEVAKAIRSLKSLPSIGS